MQGSGRITVQVKTPKEKQSVEIEDNASIKQVRGGGRSEGRET